MKGIWSVLIAIPLFLSWTSSAVTAEPEAGAKSLMGDVTVTVLNYDWKGEILAQGKGFFITREGDLVVPVWILEGGSWAEIRTAGGQTLEIDRVIAVDEYSGLMRVRTKEAAHPKQVVKVFGPVLQDGDMVYVPETGVGRNATVVSARVFPHLEEFCFVRLSTEMGPAGSPLFSADGSLRGVVLFSREEAPKEGILVSSESVLLLSKAGMDEISRLDWAELEREAWRDCFIGQCLEGMTLAWSGAFEEACGPLTEAIDMGGGNMEEILICLGDCYAACGRNEKAAGVYRRALSLAPSRIDLYSKLAYVMLEQGLKEEAAETARQAVQECPRVPGSHILLARVLNAAGEHEEARLAAQACVEIAPRTPEGWLEAGMACIGMGRYGEAVEVIQQTLVLQPGNTEALANLGYAYLRSGQLFKAIVLLGHAVREPAESGDTLKALGEAYDQVRLDQKAARAYRMAISLDPMDCQAYWRLGDLCLEMGDLDEAVAVCSQAVTRHGQNPWLRYKLGKALCEKGDQEGAEEQIRVLRDLNPGLAEQLQLKVDRGRREGLENKEL